MRTCFTRSLASLALATIATPALADEITIRVPYADIDLASDEGFEVLRTRIADAAEAACTAAEDADFSPNRVSDCQSMMMRKARGQIDALRIATPGE